MIFRKVLFWVHLVAGLTAGLAIAIMCFTGTALAFEKQLVGWAERNVRTVAAPPSGTPRLPLDELVRRARSAQPEVRPNALMLSPDANAAVALLVGRDAALYMNPYTGEARAPDSTKLRDALHVMQDWHRWLALSGDQRPIGKAINGVCNAAFLLLAVTGLYLWLPRSWSWRSVRAVSFFDWRLTGKARDFNWHNTIGLWCAPVLIVLTLTALPMSFRWANTLLYRITSSELPASNATPTPPLLASPPAPDATPLSYEALIAAAEKYVPKWSSATLRLPAPSASDATAPAAKRPAVSITLKPREPSPVFENVQLTLNPYTGGLLRFENYSGATKGRKLRLWTRFLHTGEALGFGGQAVAALASLGGCFLVYTGFALAVRRFFGRPSVAAPNGGA